MTACPKCDVDMVRHQLITNACPRDFMPAKKGHFGYECNRERCNNAPATWYNWSTKAYYCAGCARKINEACNEIVCRQKAMQQPNNLRNRWRRMRDTYKAYGWTGATTFRDWARYSRPGSYSANHFVEEFNP